MSRTQETFGQRLAKYRKIRDLSQAELAQGAGSTQAQISKYERDEVMPSLETLPALAEALTITTDALLGYEAPKFAPPGEASAEDLTLEMLKRFGIRGKRLDLIRFALLGEEPDIRILVDQLPAFEESSTGKGRKGSAGA